MAVLDLAEPSRTLSFKPIPGSGRSPRGASAAASSAPEVGRRRERILCRAVARLPDAGGGDARLWAGAFDLIGAAAAAAPQVRRSD